LGRELKANAQGIFPEERRGAKSTERSYRMAAERLGAAILGNIWERMLASDISQNPGFVCSAAILQVRSEDSTSRRSTARRAGERPTEGIPRARSDELTE
jgi:hypothetical protein